MSKRSIPTEAYQFMSDSELKLSGSDGKPKQFSGTAYAGGILQHPFWGEVAFDLATLTSRQKLPMLIGHDRDKNAFTAAQAA